MRYLRDVPNAVVIHRDYEEWEVWDGGLLLEPTLGRWVKRGTFTHHWDAENFAQRINGNGTC